MNSELLQPLMRDWLIKDKKVNAAHRTFDTQTRLARLHIYPYIGNLPISEVNTQIIQTLFSETLSKAKKLSADTINKCKYLLNDFFGFCYKTSLISENPVSTVSLKELSEEEQEKPRNLSPDERQRFLTAVTAHKFWKPFCLTIMCLGLRVNEILALKWKDIDFDRKVMKVENILKDGFMFDGKKKSKKYQHIHPQKPRVISLTDFSINLFLEYREQRKEAEQFQENYTYVANWDFIFGNEESEMRSKAGTSHVFRKFLKSQGLGDLNVTLNVLRNTHREIARENSPHSIVWLSGNRSDHQSVAQLYSNINVSGRQEAVETYRRVKKDIEM